MTNLPNINDNDYLKARKKIIDDFVKSVYGNDWQSDDSLQLDFNPIYQFTSGVLFPQEQNFEDNINISDQEDFEDVQEEQNINSESLKKPKTDADDDEETTNDLDIIDLSTQYRPSAVGITFIVNLEEILKVSFGYSKYIKDPVSKNWNQIKSRHELTINLFEEENYDEYFEDKLLRFNLKKKIKNDQAIVSISLSNQNISTGDNSHATENCFFNVGINIKSLNESFLPIRPALQSASGNEQDSLELLFRKKQSFSTGKGCATDWLLSDEGDCREIWTTFIPEYELENISARSDDSLRMSEFCDIDDINPQNRFDKILDLSKNYKIWLDNLINESDTLNSKEKETALRHFNSIEEYQKRINTGINLIQSNKDVEDAFRLTNLAMLIQFNRGKNLKAKKSSEELNCDDNEILGKLSNNNYNNLNGSWRPFQLAFLLACIPDIFEPENDENYRDIVDLIWFPTGGGKTEAYLAVLAFVIILRRIKDPDDIGVSAIMRYTLRLLTSDQFRRSSGLICALEFIRRESIFGINLGTEEISIGLWIGQTASPRDDKTAKTWLNDEKHKDRNGRYKFILNECPWCKSDLNEPKNSGYEIRPKGRKEKVIIFCPDEKCFYHESLPIYLWQESIWDKKPSLILSTVDSFAKLTWYKEAISLFFNKFSPPELIIQDELHLISGPLGTIMGLYEVALLKLLTKENKRPKIIGASATLTFSDQQSKSLYIGRESSIFPPQGLNWGDSFFAQELPLEEKPGRVYLGYFGSVKGSMVESAISGAIPLLQSPMQKRPYLIEDAKKGDLEIVVNEQANLREGNTFSIFHTSEMTNYKISKINDYNERKDDFADAKIISLEDPIITNIKSLKSFGSGQKEIRETLFPEYTEKDTAFDPYGTLVWYFNSKRELAYMSNQMIRLRDILEGDAKKINKGNLGTDLSDTTFARKIIDYEELTGRLTQDEIETIVNKLNKNWTQSREYGGDYFKGIDILLATNMISVGVDISRLGLMLVHGHPRSTAEYIQCTSRVGRVHPGLVVTVYNHNKSKDRSIYELFKNYHQSFYRYVEGVSITPFSLGSIKRALPAVFVALIRSYDEIEDPNIRGRDEIINEVKEWILNAVIAIDSSEYNDVNSMLDNIIEKWKNSDPSDWGSMSQLNSEAERLLSSKSDRNTTFNEIPTSMRNTAEQVKIKLKGN